MGKETGIFKCTKCKELRQSSYFARDASLGDGRARTCFCCRRVNVRKSRKGMVSFFKGKLHSIQTRMAMSIAKRGMQFRLGKTHSLKTRELISRKVIESIKSRNGGGVPIRKDIQEYRKNFPLPEVEIRGFNSGRLHLSNMHGYI